MGNVTKPRKPSPKRNANLVERQRIAVNSQLRQVKNEAAALQNAFKRIGTRLKSGTFNERDIVATHLIHRRMRELVAEKKALDAMYASLLRHQITHGL